MAMKSSSSESSVGGFWTILYSIHSDLSHIQYPLPNCDHFRFCPNISTGCLLKGELSRVKTDVFSQCERGGGRVTPCVKGYVADCDMILEAFWQHKFTFLTFLKNCNDLPLLLSPLNIRSNRWHLNRA